MNSNKIHVAPYREDKLPHELEHLDALHQMRALDTYYRWSLSRLKPWTGRRIMDAGCGIGNGTELLLESADYVLAADLSRQNIEALKDRFSDRSQVEPLQVDLVSNLGFLSDRKLDTILCMDVLEHIEDDSSLLRQFGSIVQPGGHLLIKVPACEWLFGSVDRASGHFRRYSRRTLADVASRAGWEPVMTAYMNIFGIIPYFLKSRVFCRDANFSRTFSRNQLRMIQTITPLLRRLDRLLGPPIGQSVLLVARRASEDFV